MIEPEYEISYRKPVKRPVDRIVYTGPLHTVLEARVDAGGTFAEVSISYLSSPDSNHFDAEACREAAKFFERLATIIDNGGYEIE